MVMRKVWLVKAPVSAGAGAVVQVPTQCWFSGITSLPIWQGVVGSANLMPEAVPSPTQSAGAPTPLFLLFYQVEIRQRQLLQWQPAPALGADAHIDIV